MEQLDPKDKIAIELIKQQLINHCPTSRLNIKVELYKDATNTCADCGGPSNYKITEDNGDIWFYCGICDIGG